jgi:4-alpha-glucanotransferase
MGWWKKDAGGAEKQRFFKYIGKIIDESEINWEFIRLAMTSIADTAIFPMQDLLGLGAGAKMNRPSTESGNWEWRLRPGYYRNELINKLREITLACGRG